MKFEDCDGDILELSVCEDRSLDKGQLLFDIDGNIVAFTKDQCKNLIETLVNYYNTIKLPESKEDPLDRYLDELKNDCCAKNVKLFAIQLCQEIKQLKEKIK